MGKAPQWLGALLARLREAAPAQLLLVAPASHPLQALLAAELSSTTIVVASPSAALRGTARADVAVVAGLPETMAAPAARELLAALRDRLASSVVLIVDIGAAPLPENDLRALGYRVLARDGAALLLGFDLHDYKDRPDWLNASHWAHPELWDKYRW